MINSKLMVIINVKSSMKCMKGLHVVIFPCDFFFCNLLIIKVLLQTWKLLQPKKIFDNHNKTCSNIDSTIWTKTQNMSLLVSCPICDIWNEMTFYSTRLYHGL
jgi:hypothetical protein